MMNKKRIIILLVLLFAVVGFTMSSVRAKTYNFKFKEFSSSNSQYWGQNKYMAVNSFYYKSKYTIEITSLKKVKYIKYYYYKNGKPKVKKFKVKQSIVGYSAYWGGKIRDYSKTVKIGNKIGKYPYPYKIGVVV
jgi:hypothetical protein